MTDQWPVLDETLRADIDNQTIRQPECIKVASAADLRHLATGNCQQRRSDPTAASSTSRPARCAVAHRPAPAGARIVIVLHGAPS